MAGKKVKKQKLVKVIDIQDFENQFGFSKFRPLGGQK